MSRREVGEAVLPLIRGIGEGVYHFISLSSPLRLAGIVSGLCLLPAVQLPLPFFVLWNK